MPLDSKNLDKEALHEIQRCLLGIGYAPDLLIPHYKFHDFISIDSSDSTVREIELGAFAQTPPSLRSACFGITRVSTLDSAAISPFRALGAPQVLALHGDTQCVRRWKISADSVEQLDEFPYNAIADKFKEHADQWSPRRILEAKTLSFIDGPPQLDFFDTGLLPSLEATLREKLQRFLNNLIVSCNDVYKEWHLGEDLTSVLEQSFRLVFRLIAAKMLIDRGNKPEWATLKVQDVINGVDSFYFANESSEPILGDSHVQQTAWIRIRDGLNLQNLSVETLAYLYEHAFVTQEMRRKQGIHATPHEIAEYVVRNLPFDQIAQDDRKIFEPFTGAAPFLTAALSRLRELLPADFDPSKRHSYFVNMLFGQENEHFSREIARYSLILADYPNPNGWEISRDDAYTGSTFGENLEKARVVLCNPPFGAFTPEEREHLPIGAHYKKEHEALRRVLEHPPLMLGFVLPRSILDREDFASLRDKIASLYRNTVVTLFPESAFRVASQETVVILAHNFGKAPSRQAARITSAEYSLFKQTGLPPWTKTVVLPKGSSSRLWCSPLDDVWNALSRYPVLGEFAEAHEGVRYKKEMRDNCIVSKIEPGFVPGVHCVDGYVEPYLIKRHQYFSTEPQAMYNLAFRRPWNEPKVIVNRARISRGPWRAIAVADYQGVWASRQFIGIWPSVNLPIEVLSAIINGPVGNGFLYTHSQERENNPSLLLKIPIPRFTDDQIDLICALVEKYVELREQGLRGNDAAPKHVHQCLLQVHKIDAAVLQAYNLDASLESDLLGLFSGAAHRRTPFIMSGYDETFAETYETIRSEYQARAVVSRYQELVDKKYASSLSRHEQAEIKRLGQIIDEASAPFDEAVYQSIEGN